MHPSPAALMTMTNDELLAYREDLRNLALDNPALDGIDGPYMSRVGLIDRILADRKHAAQFEADNAAPAVLDAESDDAATMNGWSDRTPATIIKRTAKTITVQADRTANMSSDKHDTYAHGHGEVVIFTRDTDGPMRTYTLRKNGRWIQAGAPMKSAASLTVGTRSYYRDPSF